MVLEPLRLTPEEERLLCRVDENAFGDPPKSHGCGYLIASMLSILMLAPDEDVVAGVGRNAGLDDDEVEDLVSVWHRVHRYFERLSAALGGVVVEDDNGSFYLGVWAGGKWKRYVKFRWRWERIDEGRWELHFVPHDPIKIPASQMPRLLLSL